MSRLDHTPGTPSLERSDPVRTAHAPHDDTERAVDALLDRLEAPRADLIFLFFSPAHDESIIRDRLDREVSSRAVAGTTAGELSDQGFNRHSMTGMSLRGDDVRAAVDIVPNLEELSLVPLSQSPKKLAGQIGRDPEQLDPDRHIWILLLDGLSGSEELVTPFFMQSAPETGLVGGSLGDDLEYDRTSLVHRGRTYSDAAALVLLEYDRPFSLFSGNHMAFTDQTVEVTGVAEGGRVLTQLDGADPIRTYADLLDLEPDHLHETVIAGHPLGFQFRGEPFVCSIRQILADGSFEMGNSVQTGDELHLLEARDLVPDTQRVLDRARADLGEEVDPRGMLAFNCVGRYLEAEITECTDGLAEALTRFPVAGLNTYGEQFGAIHTNHSLTGVLFG